MWIPQPIYKRLPQIYAGAAVACVLSFDLASLADVSAALLLAAAASVAIQRRPNKILTDARSSWIARQRRSDCTAVPDLKNAAGIGWRFPWKLDRMFEENDRSNRGSRKSRGSRTARAARAVRGSRASSGSARLAR